MLAWILAVLSTGGAPPVPLLPPVPMVGRGGDRKRPLEVQVENRVGVGAGQNDLSRRRPRQMSRALQERPLVQADQALVAILLQLLADVLINGDAATKVGARVRRQGLVEGTGQHSSEAGVAGAFPAAGHVLDELVVDPLQQQQVRHVGFQRVLETHRAERPTRRIVAGGRPIVDAAQHPIGPAQDVHPLDAAHVAGRVRSIGLQHGQQGCARSQRFEETASGEPKIAFHHARPLAR